MRARVSKSNVGAGFSRPNPSLHGRSPRTGRGNPAPTSRVNSLARAIAFLLAGAILLGIAGCHDDMWVQPKVHKPYQQSDFFADGQTARPFVKGTVAREWYWTDQTLATGFTGKKLATEFPFQITREDLERGQNRFNIYCSPCHGALGYGDGMIARRGFNIRRTPGNYHIERLRRAPVGHFYDVITNGFGTMYSYSNRIPDAKERWRIVAYIRVLQASQNAKTSDLSQPDLDRLNQTGVAAPPPAGEQ